MRAAFSNDSPPSSAPRGASPAPDVDPTRLPRPAARSSLWPLASAAPLGAAFAAALLAISIVAPRAVWAHASLVEARPGRRAVVTSVPARVVLVFSDALEEAFSTVQVLSAGGKRIDTGDIRVLATDRRELSVGLAPGLPAGAYTVKYRVLSADGHVVEGSYRFTVKPAP